VLGSGAAWTFNKYTVSGSITTAIYGMPPNNPLSQSIIIVGYDGGTSGSNTTFAWATGSQGTGVNYGGILEIGLAKNTLSGAFSGRWFVAPGLSPFTAGFFSGYQTFFNANQVIANRPGVGVNIQIRLYESADGVLCAINPVAGNNYSCYFIAGGLVDPETNDTTIDAESDGKLYVLGNGRYAWDTANIGSHAYSINGAVNGSTTYGVFGNHTTSADLNCAYNKFLYFEPNSGSMQPLTRLSRNVQLPTTNNYTTKSGKHVSFPYYVSRTRFSVASQNSLVDPAVHYGGKLRGIYVSEAAVCGTTLKNGSDVVGYFISNSSAATGSGYFLKY
jgi:hypothetical protein